MWSAIDSGSLMPRLTQPVRLLVWKGQGGELYAYM